MRSMRHAVFKASLLFDLMRHTAPQIVSLTSNTLYYPFLFLSLYFLCLHFFYIPFLPFIFHKHFILDDSNKKFSLKLLILKMTKNSSRLHKVAIEQCFNMVFKYFTQNGFLNVFECKCKN